MSTQFHIPGEQATTRPVSDPTATTAPIRPVITPADAGRRIGVGVDARRLWAGGAASALVAGLVALVGVLACRWLFHLSAGSRRDPSRERAHTRPVPARGVRPGQTPTLTLRNDLFTVAKAPE
jgi:hypothetical protein